MSAGPVASDDEKLAKSEQALHQDDKNQSKSPENNEKSDTIKNDTDKNNETTENPNTTDQNNDLKNNDIQLSDKDVNESEKENKNTIDKNNGNVTEDNENQTDKKDIEITDGFISATESVSNSESPVKDINQKEEDQTNSKEDENTNLIQQTDTIIKAIIGLSSENNEKDENQTQSENNDDKKVEDQQKSENSDSEKVENQAQNENNENNENDENQQKNEKNDDEKVEDQQKSENSDNEKVENQAQNENNENNENDENQTQNENNDDKKVEDQQQSENSDSEKVENQAQNEKNDNNENDENPQKNENDSNEDEIKERKSNADELSRDSNENESESSHPLSNLINVMTDKIQSDTVQITDAFSQTDPVPISVSCQTSFPPSEIESEEDNTTAATTTTAMNQDYQPQEDLFASFNCRCTQTRKLDKSLPKTTDSRNKTSTHYLHPRKTSQSIRPKTANKTTKKNALLQLEISQPISPIQFRSSANSAVSSNVESPRSSAASTLSSSAENKRKNNVKPIKNIKNTLPIITSKSLSSNTTRPRVNNSGFSSSSGPEPTKTPNIKTGKLSMIKNGNSQTSKSCVLKRNINIRPNTMKTVLNSNKSSQKSLNDGFLDETVHQMTNNLLPENSQSDDLSTKERNQSSNESSTNAEEKNKKKTADTKVKNYDLDEQLTALTANLLPGSQSSAQNSSSCSKKFANSSNKTNQKSATTSSIPTTKNTTLGGTSQIENGKLSSSSSSIKENKLDSTIEEEEETSSDDPNAPKIIKKRDYQGNTTEINFTDETDKSSQVTKEQEEEQKNDAASTTTAAADDESGNPDYEQMIDDIIQNGYVIPDDESETTSLINYIKRQEIDSIINEDYTNCDRLRQASSIIANSRNRIRFIAAHYEQIESRLAKAESDLDELQNVHKERLEQFESDRLLLLDSLRERQQQEIDNFESFWSHQHALLPFEKSSSGLLDLRFKQKQSALIKEFSTANDLKSIADSLQIIEEDGAIVSAESSMKTAYQQLLYKHAQQDSAFNEKMQRHHQYLQNQADNEIARQKLIIQQLEAKRDEKYDARARNNALSEIDLLSEPVSPRTFESFTKYRKDVTASKLRLNSTSIVQTLHQKKQTKRPFTPGKTKRYGGYC